MLMPSSRVILVARDFPYYKLVFNGVQNIQITVFVVYNFYNGQVQVMSVTSSQSSTIEGNNTGANSGLTGDQVQSNGQTQSNTNNIQTGGQVSNTVGASIQPVNQPQSSSTGQASIN
jgi:hypothetical protein